MNVTLAQGDNIRGTLPLEDLASVSVASLYTKRTRNTVFEVVTGEEGAEKGFSKLVEGIDGSEAQL